MTVLIDGVRQIVQVRHVDLTGLDYASAGHTGFAGTSSPTFTGTPSAPTAVAGTSTTQIATTAFVLGTVSGYIKADTTVPYTNTFGITRDVDNSFLDLSGGKSGSIRAIVRACGNNYVGASGWILLYVPNTAANAFVLGAYLTAADTPTLVANGALEVGGVTAANLGTNIKTLMMVYGG